jgi:hypothetical protein
MAQSQEMRTHSPDLIARMRSTCDPPRVFVRAFMLKRPARWATMTRRHFRARLHLHAQVSAETVKKSSGLRG